MPESLAELRKKAGFASQQAAAEWLSMSIGWVQNQELGRAPERPWYRKVLEYRIAEKAKEAAK